MSTASSSDRKQPAEPDQAGDKKAKVPAPSKNITSSNFKTHWLYNGVGQRVPVISAKCWEASLVKSFVSKQVGSLRPLYVTNLFRMCYSHCPTLKLRPYFSLAILVRRVVLRLFYAVTDDRRKTKRRFATLRMVCGWMVH